MTENLVIPMNIDHFSLKPGGKGGKMGLKCLELYKRRIDFTFCSADDAEKTFKYSMPLDGTSGEFQVHEGESRFVVAKWEDGSVTEARRMICPSSMPVAEKIIIPDDDE